MPSIVLFDGVCNLCNGFVRFVIARDPATRFQFAPLQSETAGRLIRGAGGAGTTVTVRETTSHFLPMVSRLSLV